MFIVLIVELYQLVNQKILKFQPEIEISASKNLFIRISISFLCLLKKMSIFSIKGLIGFTLRFSRHLYYSQAKCPFFAMMDHIAFQVFKILYRNVNQYTLIHVYRIAQIYNRVAYVPYNFIFASQFYLKLYMHCTCIASRSKSSRI